MHFLGVFLTELEYLAVANGFGRNEYGMKDGNLQTGVFFKETTTIAVIDLRRVLVTKETIESRREAVKLITKSSFRGNHECYTTKATMNAKE